ncbi:MAG TPA: methyltransferase domain-containing protein [Candidatus Paceibacterota bacterium]|nr:methyltransferase domain-containing protein [Candidatus Paceibacterota bacterium]
MNKTQEQRFNKVKESVIFKRIRSKYSLSEKRVLDIGCGYGEYLLFFGKGSVGLTTDEEEIKFGKDNKLNIKFGNAEFLEESLSGDEGFEAIWANNLFEHLLSPHSFLMKLKNSSEGDTKLILGVPVIPSIYFLTGINKFKGAFASNHIGFYTRMTLRLTIERAGWVVEDIRPFIFYNKYLDFLASFLSPHLYVIARNNTNFIYPSKKFNEWFADKHYDFLFKITGQK